MILKSIAAFAVFYIIAAFIGVWGDIIRSSFGGKRSVCFRAAFGGCLLILLGSAVCLAGSLFGASSDICICITAFIILLVGITGILVNKRMHPDTDAAAAPFRAADIAGLCVIAALAAFQIFMAIRYQNENTEVLRGLGSATMVYETGTLSVSGPVNLFIGALCRVVHVHPLAFVYVMLPAPLILLYYLCYLELIRTVCTSWRDTLIAMTVVSLLNIWGFQSDLLLPVTMLAQWYGFWVFLTHGVLNVSAVILICYMQTRTYVNVSEDSDTDGYSEEWDMKKHKIVNARNLAIGLGVVALVLVAAVCVLNNKINSLYAATVNLQDDMNRRCSIYEFTPDGEETEGYLIRESDGKITFVGGGGAQNSDALRDFLDKYGYVANWYVYGTDEDNAGAMYELISDQSVSPDNIYVIDRQEITGIR